MNRLLELRENFAKLKLDGMLITSTENRRYLSGFTGSAGVLVIDDNNAFLVTDFRYWEQAAAQAKHFELSKQGPELNQSVVELMLRLGWKQVGFESEALTYQDYQKIRAILPETIELTPVADLVRRQRAVKTAEEIELLVEAARITDRAWAKTLELIKPGIRETEIAMEYDYQLRRNGAEGCSFATIVASGGRAALPHAVPTDKTVGSGDLVLLDGGAKYRGYHADMTRTVVVGKPDAKQQEIYQIVLGAQQRALDALRAGVIGREIDALARDYITERGYGDYFGHGLGHCVGLNIHENPRLSPLEAESIPLGAVITVEPGIYLPEWGGVRIEDLVVVEAEGIRNLTGSAKQELLEV